MSLDSVENTLREMRKSYGSFLDQSAMVALNANNVPDGLVRYIPYAALWGIADDLEREQLISFAPDDAKKDLLRVVRLINNQLDDWLAGVEADSPAPSAEYVAFSAMLHGSGFCVTNRLVSAAG